MSTCSVLTSAAVRKGRPQIACSLKVLKNRSMRPLRHESPSCRIQACGRPDHAPGRPRAITTMFGWLTLTHILLGKLKITWRDTDQCFRIRVMPQEIRYPN